MYIHCNSNQILAQCHLSKTAHRIDILDILIQASRPLSAGEIAAAMHNRKGINKVTIYRTLTSFKHAGIIREIEASQESKLYEIACKHNPVHPHFFCVKCRTMACLSSVSSSDYRKWFKGCSFTIENISIQLSGVCAKCHTEH